MTVEFVMSMFVRVLTGAWRFIGRDWGEKARRKLLTL